MNRKEYLEQFGNLLNTMYDITEAKNTDYSKDENPFSNFNMSELLGICTTEESILVRMTDKLSRISNLIHQKNLVSDERIEDTLIDLAVYSLILNIYLGNK